MSIVLLDKVRAFCQQHQLFTWRDSVVIAVSGGADSVCLWHLLRTLQSEWNLTLIIAHLNHGLRGAAALADEQFVRDLAAEWQNPVYVERQNVAQIAADQKQSLEEAARHVRYDFLQKIANQTQATKIAVAHQANDQAETVLMRLIRGTGLQGLRGMLPATRWGESHRSLTVIRPLLAVNRGEIEQYIQTHSLRFCQDESNFDLDFWRNRVRHEVLPYLKRYNPNLDQALNQLAEITTADVAWLDETLAEVWSTLVVTETANLLEFKLACWFDLPLSLQRLALRRALQQLAGGGGRDIGFEHIEQAIALLARRPTGAQLTWPHGLKLTISYHTCLLFNSQAIPPVAKTPTLMTDVPLEVTVPGVTPLPYTSWQLHCQILPMSAAISANLKQPNPWVAYLDAAKVGGTLTLRPRQKGDKFAPWGGHGQQTKLKTFMINAKIPLAERDHIPLLVAQNQIIWLCGYRLAHDVAVQTTTQYVIYLFFELTT